MNIISNINNHKTLRIISILDYIGVNYEFTIENNSNDSKYPKIIYNDINLNLSELVDFISVLSKDNDDLNIKLEDNILSNYNKYIDKIDSILIKLKKIIFKNKFNKILLLFEKLTKIIYKIDTILLNNKYIFGNKIHIIDLFIFNSFIFPFYNILSDCYKDIYCNFFKILNKVYDKTNSRQLLIDNKFYFINCPAIEDIITNNKKYIDNYIKNNKNNISVFSLKNNLITENESFNIKNIKLKKNNIIKLLFVIQKYLNLSNKKEPIINFIKLNIIKNTTQSEFTINLSKLLANISSDCYILKIKNFKINKQIFKNNYKNNKEYIILSIDNEININFSMLENTIISYNHDTNNKHIDIFMILTKEEYDYLKNNIAITEINKLNNNDLNDIILIKSSLIKLFINTGNI